jgi:hypothetical protein
VRTLGAALVLLAAIALGMTNPLVCVPRRSNLRVPTALITGAGLLDLEPHRGASRDRSRPGKARRSARRARA